MTINKNDTNSATPVDLLTEFDALEEYLSRFIDELSTVDNRTDLDDEEEIFAFIASYQRETIKTQPVTTQDLVEEALGYSHDIQVEQGQTKVANQSSLISSIGHLLADFDPLYVDSFYVKCQHLIDSYGFIEFKEAIDTVLMNRKIVHTAQHNEILANSIRAINHYINKTMADTFAAIELEAAKIQARGILDVLHNTDDELLEKAKSLARKDTENKAIADSAQVEHSDLDEQGKRNVIDAIQRKKEERLADINEMKIPLAYYIEKARLNTLKHARELFLPDTGQNIDQIVAYIKKDLLMTDDSVSSRDLLKLRVLKLERYLLIAEKLIEEKRASAAFNIYTALASTEICRLKATFDSLSRHAQEHYKRMEDLFNPRGDFKEYVKHVYSGLN